MRDDAKVPTLREIALAAGVSAMTVSRILKNHPHHNPDTAKHVLKIARKLGYRPNPLVSALMSQRVRQHGNRATANLAILDPRAGDPNANANFIRGATEHAWALGYTIHTYPYNPAELAPARQREILINRAVRGIILMPLPVSVGRVEFDFAGFAVATIGNSLQEPRLPRVANDAQNALYEALSRLESLGYQRVGLIMSADATRRTLNLYPGACFTFNRFLSKSLQVTDLVIPDETFSASQRRDIASWIRSNHLQAVLSPIGELFGVLSEAGFTIPGDLAYLHLHKHPLDRVTSMDQMRAYQGQKALDIVAGMIQRNESAPVEHAHTVLTPSVWCDGRTTPVIAPAISR